MKIVDMVLYIANDMKKDTTQAVIFTEPDAPEALRQADEQAMTCFRDGCQRASISRGIMVDIEVLLNGPYVID